MRKKIQNFRGSISLGRDEEAREENGGIGRDYEGGGLCVINFWRREEGGYDAALRSDQSSS